MFQLEECRNLSGIILVFQQKSGDKKIKGEDTVASLKLTGSAEIGLKSSVGVDVDFGIPFVQDFSFNSFDFKVDIDGQVSGGISFGADNDDYAESNFKQITHNGVKDKEALKKVTNALREKAKYDVYLGAVPLDGKNRKTSVYLILKKGPLEVQLRCLEMCLVDAIVLRDNPASPDQ